MGNEKFKENERERANSLLLFNAVIVKTKKAFQFYGIFIAFFDIVLDEPALGVYLFEAIRDE